MSVGGWSDRQWFAPHDRQHEHDNPNKSLPSAHQDHATWFFTFAHATPHAAPHEPPAVMDRAMRWRLRRDALRGRASATSNSRQPRPVGGVEACNRPSISSKPIWQIRKAVCVYVARFFMLHASWRLARQQMRSTTAGARTSSCSHWVEGRRPVAIVDVDRRIDDERDHIRQLVGPA